VIMGANALDPSRREDAGVASATAVAVEPTPQSEMQVPAIASCASTENIEKVQAAVLQTLSDNNQRILVSMLSSGDWSLQGNEVMIKVAESQTVVDMSLGTEGKRLAIAAASGILGRPVRLKVVPGAAVQEKKNGAPKLASGPGGRSRAEQDPIVRRMQEKFSAEIRTVIDYRDKR
jgi:hypothetical protein